QMKDDLDCCSSVTLSGLDNRGLGADCNDEDRSLLRAFCNFRGGARGRVRRLGGGLSGGAVYRLDVLAADNSVTQRCVAKFDDSAEQIDTDSRNYGQHVTRLPEGYPAAIPVDLIVGGRRRGVFYNLAEGFECSLFDFL